MVDPNMKEDIDEGNLKIGYLTGGIYEDVERLIDEFLETNSVEFDAFSKVWKKKNMSYIYVDQKNASDLDKEKLVGDLYSVALTKFSSTDSFQEKAGCVYTLYSVYFTHPGPHPVPIRVTIDQWSLLEEFTSSCRQLQHVHLLYVIWKLRRNHAFHFVHLGHELHPLRKPPGESSNFKEKSIVERVLNNSETQQTVAIHERYVAMKDQLESVIGAEGAHLSLTVPHLLDTNLLPSIANAVNDLKRKQRENADDYQ